MTIINALNFLTHLPELYASNLTKDPGVLSIFVALISPGKYLQIGHDLLFLNPYLVTTRCLLSLHHHLHSTLHELCD